MRIIIVGAGLFGSLAATLARKQGAEVTLIDSGEAYAASKASGCVLKPSWMASLTKEEIATGYEVLRSLYAVKELEFSMHLGLTVKAQHVDPRKVLVKPDVREKVVAVGDGRATLASGTVLKGTVLVAAGIWSGQLVKMPPIKGLYGASLWYPDQQLKAPRLNVYAPYRQAVAFNIGSNEVWMGDGTALIERSWKEERVELTAKRAAQLFKLRGPYRAIVGARPYVEGHSRGYLEKVSSRTWVSTGGAKNGTILAALFAHQFVKEAF